MRRRRRAGTRRVLHFCTDTAADTRHSLQHAVSHPLAGPSEATKELATPRVAIRCCCCGQLSGQRRLWPPIDRADVTEVDQRHTTAAATIKSWSRHVAEHARLPTRRQRLS